MGLDNTTVNTATVTSKRTTVINKKYKKPRGCYSCIHFKWIDNPKAKTDETEFPLIPSCSNNYDGIMKNFFRLQQSKKISDVPTLNCMVLHDDDDEFELDD